MTRRSSWRSSVIAVLAVVVAAATVLAACGGKTETTAGGAPSSSASAMVSPSPSAPVDDAVPAGWKRMTVGEVSVGVPKGWGYVTLENGKLNTHGMDLTSQAATSIEHTLTVAASGGDSGFVLLDKSTPGSLLESWITAVEVFTIGSAPPSKTTEELQAALSEAYPDHTVGPFVHPVMPAAVSKGVDKQAGEVHHLYAIGYYPVIAVELSTDERNPGPDIKTAEEIVRTIRLVQS